MADGDVILIDKPKGWTSFDVVKYIRKSLSNIKTGHAGTLDPLADGLLIVCTGRKTKIIAAIQDAEKEYKGIFCLGAQTDSYDAETELHSHQPFESIKVDAIYAVAKNFIGTIDQIPPVHSAIKVNGQRAYDIARKGEVVDLKARKVEIKEFEILKIELPLVHFRLVCSKGTYVRSLANDFGQMLGCGAYLFSLTRLRIGEYLLRDAVKPGEFNQNQLKKNKL